MITSDNEQENASESTVIRGNFDIFYVAPSGGAEYCDERVCLSVREHISQATCLVFAKFLCLLPMAVAWTSYGGIVIQIRYVYFCFYERCHVCTMHILARNGRREKGVYL